MKTRLPSRRSALSACALLVASGFAPISVPAAMAQTVRDSAGIQILSSAAPAWTTGREWRLAPMPQFRTELASGLQGGRVWSRITGVVLLSDGRILVGNGKTYEIEVFDSTGKRLSAFGRQGQGPGEFQELHNICRMRGDTVLVQNATRGVHFFAPDGRYVRSVPLPDLRASFPVGRMEMQACLADGSTIFMKSGSSADQSRNQWTDSAFAYFAARDGSLRSSVGPVPVMTWVTSAGIQWPLPMGPSGRHAFFGGIFYAGFPTDFSVRVYDESGKLSRIFRRSWTPTPVTAADIKTYRDYQLNQFKSYDDREEKQHTAMLNGLEFPRNHPAFDGMMTDALGNLWVRERRTPYVAPVFNAAPPISRWTVFDARGRWLGGLQMPARFTPMLIGADFVLGTARDADDLEYLVRYRLQKPM